jgi:hypothetical protein
VPPLTLPPTGECAANCTDHGTCEGGRCECSEGFAKSEFGGCQNASLLATGPKVDETTVVPAPSGSGSPDWLIGVIVAAAVVVVIATAAGVFFALRRRRASADAAVAPTLRPQTDIYNDVGMIATAGGSSADSVKSAITSVPSAPSEYGDSSSGTFNGFPKESSSYSLVRNNSQYLAAPVSLRNENYTTLASTPSTNATQDYITLRSMPTNASPVVYSSLKS